MFHAWLVKMRKQAASSMPILCPPEMPMKIEIAAGKKATTGRDWKMSSSGMMMRSPSAERAATSPSTYAKTSDAAYETVMRKKDSRSAQGSSAMVTCSGLSSARRTPPL
jgi:hypothetical protein